METRRSPDHFSRWKGCWLASGCRVAERDTTAEVFRFAAISVIRHWIRSTGQLARNLAVNGQEDCASSPQEQSRSTALRTPWFLCHCRGRAYIQNEGLTALPVMPPARGVPRPTSLV